MMDREQRKQSQKSTASPVIPESPSFASMKIKVLLTLLMWD
jgi:hypothetical protein